MGDAVQAIQSITADVFVLIEASVVVQQSLQTVSVSGIVQYPSALQAKQGLNVEGFIKISADCVLTQSAQTVQSTAFYYDVAINANMMQPLQGVMIDAQVSVATEAIYLEQPKQYMSCTAISAVITAQAASRVYDRAWILRRVRNKGAR
ncbi:MAG TPA: hypothetical protein PKL36_09555 [Agitococcus sp.]|nr:hypothetical protein [Agitococcus sp.]